MQSLTRQRRAQDPVKAEEEREMGNKLFKEAKARRGVHCVDARAR